MLNWLNFHPSMDLVIPVALPYKLQNLTSEAMRCGTGRDTVHSWVIVYICSILIHHWIMQCEFLFIQNYLWVQKVAYQANDWKIQCRRLDYLGLQVLALQYQGIKLDVTCHIIVRVPYSAHYWWLLDFICHYHTNCWAFSKPQWISNIVGLIQCLGTEACPDSIRSSSLTSLLNSKFPTIWSYA